MEANPVTSGSREAPHSASATASATATATATATAIAPSSSSDQVVPPAAPPPSRYEAQKRRDWNTFQQYLRNHKPPLSPSRCNGAHVIEFLRYLDQFGKTRVHLPACAFFGRPDPPAPCACPLRQAWGSLDALVGRLRAAFEESGGRPADSSPFAARAVRAYLRDIRDSQASARGIPYVRNKKKKRMHPPLLPPAGRPAMSTSGDPGCACASTSSSAAAAAGVGVLVAGSSLETGSTSAAEEGSAAQPGDS